LSEDKTGKEENAALLIVGRVFLTPPVDATASQK